MVTIEKKLKTEYFQRFDGNASKKVGFEVEFPLVYGPAHSRAGEMISLRDMGRILKALAQTDRSYDVVNGYELEKSINGHKVVIGTDVGTGQLEIGFPATRTLAESEVYLKQFIGAVAEVAESFNIYILGSGMQPYTPPRKENMAPKERYIAMLDFLGPSVYEHTLSAASQIHVDVTREDFIETLNTLNVLSVPIIGISANSPIALGQDTGYLDYRSTIWDRNNYQYHPQNNIGRTGVAVFRDLDHFWDYFTNFPPFITKRGLDYMMHAPPPHSFKSFMIDGETDVEILGGRNGKSRLIISPTLGDVQVLEGTVWWEARPKSEFGTVESRCPALQPSISEIMAVGALIKGLSVNINGARGLVGELSENQGALADARRDVIRRGLDARVEGTSSCMSEITGEMLEIAKKGLRNSGENTGYLVPLYERLEKGVTPAEKALELFRNNTRKKFLKGLRLELE